MNIKDLKISNKIKKCKLYCVPATIRKCKGFVIETLCVQPERQNIFELLHELEDNHGYNIYPLRHKDNDMSEPHFITEKGILINRFGWFVTKDKMKFTKSDEVKLTIKNSKYYNLNSKNNKIEEECFHYGNCYEIDVIEYIINEDKIWK